MAIAAVAVPENGPEVASPPETPVLVFDHLGIIVADLAVGRAFLQNSLGISRWSEVVDDDVMGVLVQFGSAADRSGSASGPVYELVAPRGNGSPVSGQLTRAKGVLNHVAYRTADLAASAAHLRATGCFATGEPKAARAYGGALVQFWVSPLRFLIELVAKQDHTHHLLTPGEVDSGKVDSGGSGGHAAPAPDVRG